MVEYIYIKYGKEKLLELIENGGYDLEGILGVSEEEYAKGRKSFIKSKIDS